MAWYDSNWTYRVKITVQSSKVGATLTDFPVYVDLSDLPAGFFTNVDSAGDDIRVTESDGTTECAIEVVSINTGSSTGELHFLASSISAVSNTDFYIYYGNAAASAYAVGATYGRNNVWANYEMVSHDAGGTDSTGNFTLTAVSVTAGNATGKIGDATDFDGSADYAYIPSGVLTNIETNDTFTFSGWANPDILTSDGTIMGQWATPQFIVWMDTGGAGDGWAAIIQDPPSTVARAGEDVASATANVWQYVVATWDGTTVSVYTNGTLSDSNTGSGSIDNTTNLDVGIASDSGSGASRSFDGTLDELRISASALSADWISTEYNNQNDTSTFFSIGTQETEPTGTYKPKLFFFS